MIVYYCERCQREYKIKTGLCTCKGRITNWSTKIKEVEA